MKTITYYGFQIMMCSGVDSKKYYVPQTHAFTGLNVDESQCKQFDSIKAAKEHIKFTMFGHE